MTNEMKAMLGIAIATIVIVIGAAFLLSGNPTPSKEQARPKVDTKLLSNSKSHVLSAPGAKVTVVEFGDYQCPACGSAYPNVKEMLNTYKGKVNFVFRNFPLPMHQNAQIAAEAAEAAGAQGKFWEMHDELYAAQNDWADSTKPLDIFTGYAKKLGLDINKFTDDVKKNHYANVIQNDQNDGIKAGVNSTPTFFINGSMYPQVMEIEDFKAAIDPLLK